MRRNVLIAILLALAAAAAIFMLFRHSENKDGQIRVSGTFEVTSVELSFKVGGRLQQRLLNEGDTVSAGQTVARLEDGELRDERSIRAADKRAAMSGLADIQAGNRREEITQGEAALVRIKADADRLAKDAARMEQLYQREVIALKELEAARAARDASAAAVREAEDRLKLLRIGPRPEAVKERLARTEAADAALSIAETRLSQSILDSPLSGVVLAKHAEPGEMLAAGAPVLTVGKMDEVWLRAYIPENELGRIKVGQQAHITTDTWPGRRFEGRVSFISPQAEFTPKNVQTEKERVKLVYRIKITLPNPKMELKPGMPADAVIVLVDQKP
jgi:HlyD family secretion protein